MTRAILLVLALAACGHVARSQGYVVDLDDRCFPGETLEECLSGIEAGELNDDDTGEE